MEVAAYDSATPNLRDTCMVYITVLRNINGPKFTRENYDANALETSPVGTLVTGVSATDADGDAIKYRLLGPASVLPYFYLNPQTGNITLIKPLSGSTAQRFVVSAAIFW